MRRLYCIVLFALACQKPTPPAPEFIERRTDFVRDIATSEAAAGKVGKVGKAVCAGVVAREASSIAAVADAEFRGRFGSEAALDAAAWSAQLVAHVAPYVALERCGLKPILFELDPDQRGAFVRFKLTFSGRVGQGIRTDRGYLDARVVQGQTWRLARAVVKPLKTTHVDARPMTDVSALVGVSMRRGKDSEAALQAKLDGHRTETIGGLGVVDADRDGRPDLLAWHRRRALHLFRNDGRDGFTAEMDLLPPSQVGVFQLLADIDGDGADELLTTAAQCHEGRAELPIHRRVGSTFTRVGGLAFDHPCAALDRFDAQHITVGDFDQDGDLDIFVSVYRTSPPQDPVNQFDSHAGGVNRLFVNHGGRWTEEAAARGITGTRFSYGAVFFDYERDGDPDLYVVNDYGPNDLFLNDGAGRFARGAGPLTANGQSMGVTVADFDGDLDLDVYVSNMYSKAGHRIAHLVTDRLSPESAKELASLAKGNSLYRCDGPGQYTEVAQDLGVANALWAWGQAWFDADNDGDRDLYVVSGMTSHSRIREHDF